MAPKAKPTKNQQFRSFEPVEDFEMTELNK